MRRGVLRGGAEGDKYGGIMYHAPCMPYDKGSSWRCAVCGIVAAETAHWARTPPAAVNSHAGSSHES